MRGVKLNSVQCAKDLGVKNASNLKFSQQCVDAANKANRMLGSINPRTLNWVHLDPPNCASSFPVNAHLTYNAFLVYTAIFSSLGPQRSWQVDGT